MKAKKITIWVVVIFLVVMLGFLLYKSLSNSSTPQNEKVIKIGISASSYVSNAPVIIAQEKGFFSKHGLKTEIVPLDSGGLVGQALATGNLDIGSVSMAPFLMAKAKDAPVKILAASSLTSLYLFVNPNSNIVTFSDLNGKNIGARSNGGAALVLGAVCEKENTDFNSLKFIDVGEVARPIALMRKTVDAVPDDPYQKKIYEESGAVIFKGWEEKGYTKISSPLGTADTAIIAINTNLMSSDSRVVGQFVDAYIESHKFIKDYPDEAAALLSQYINRSSAGAMTPPKEDIKKSWEDGNLGYALWYDHSDLFKISEIAQKIGLIERAPTSEEMIDTRFQEKLKFAQNEIYGTNN